MSCVGERPWWPESERLRGERDQIKFIGLGFERWQVVRLRNARRRQVLGRQGSYSALMLVLTNAGRKFRDITLQQCYSHLVLF